MKRTMITIVVVTLLLAALSVSASAVDGRGPDYDTCPKDSLTPEQLEKFNEVIASYRARMAEIRAEMQELRQAGDYEGFREARDERLPVKAEKREALLEIVPAEFSDRFSGSAEGMRHHGMEKGTSGFNRNADPQGSSGSQGNGFQGGAGGNNGFQGGSRMR